MFALMRSGSGMARNFCSQPSSVAASARVKPGSPGPCCAMRTADAPPATRATAPSTASARGVVRCKVGLLTEGDVARRAPAKVPNSINTRAGRPAQPIRRSSWRGASPLLWQNDGMKTTIDRAGRVVIPAALRERAGLTAGAEIEVTLDDSAIRLERVAAGPRLVKVGRRLVARPTAPPDARPVRRRRGARRGGAQPVAVGVFLDTSVLLAGLVDFGPQSAPAQSLLHAVAERRVGDAGDGVALLPGVLLGVHAAPAGVPADAGRRRAAGRAGDLRPTVGPRPAGGRAAGAAESGRSRRGGRRPYLRRAHRGSGARRRRDGDRHRQPPALRRRRCATARASKPRPNSVASLKPRR